jgi:hypothetical protein
MMVVLAVYAGVVYVSVQRNLSQSLDKSLRELAAWPSYMMSEAEIQRLLAGNTQAPNEVEDDTLWLQLWSVEGELLYSTTPPRRSRAKPTVRSAHCVRVQ